MTDYDSMSVHELVLEAAKDGMQGFLHDANPELCELPEIESALRKAVIREASVGVITFDSAIPEPIYEMSLDLDGDYDLIPHKETP